MRLFFLSSLLLACKPTNLKIGACYLAARFPPAGKMSAANLGLGKVIHRRTEDYWHLRGKVLGRSAPHPMPTSDRTVSSKCNSMLGWSCPKMEGRLGLALISQMKIPRPRRMDASCSQIWIRVFPLKSKTCHRIHSAIIQHLEGGG